MSGNILIEMSHNNLTQLAKIAIGVLECLAWRQTRVLTHKKTNKYQ